MMLRNQLKGKRVAAMLVVAGLGVGSASIPSPAVAEIPCFLRMKLKCENPDTWDYYHQFYATMEECAAGETELFCQGIGALPAHDLGPLAEFKREADV